MNLPQVYIVFPILNPPPSPYHPSGLSQCTSPKHPSLIKSIPKEPVLSLPLSC